MLIIKTISSMEKIFPYKEPVETENSNTMFQNERFNFQLAIKNDGLEYSKLNTINVKGDLADYIILRTVELVPATYIPNETDDYYISCDIGLYPDLLKPIGKAGVTISSQQWKSVWVTVYNPKGLTAGVHTVTFEIINEKDEKECDVSYDVEVLSLHLPKADIKFTNWVHYDCIAQEHNVELFDETFYEIFNEYLRVYIECGNNMLFVPLFTPPLDTLVGCERKTTQLVKIFKDENGYKFSLDALKKFIFFAMERGIEYIEFSHLFTQWGGECCPKIVASVNGKEQKLFGWDNKSDSVEYVEFLDAFLPVLVQEIQAWGIADKCYFHLTDEPKGEHLINYEKCRNIVKKHLGDLPIMDALSNYDFYEKGLVDIPVVCTPHYAQFKERFVENIFAYYCCWPSNDYYCNRLLNMPLQRTRILGFLLYQNNAKGFLHWGFNFYNTAYSLTKVNPYEDTSAGGMFPSGDSFIVYPTKEGVLLTIRAEASREAVQDYLLCKLAESFLGKQAVMQILEKFNIRGFNEYPRSIKGHNEIRQKIITAMQNKL